jgi:hypothetical protein
VCFSKKEHQGGEKNSPVQHTTTTTHNRAKDDAAPSLRIQARRTKKYQEATKKIEKKSKETFTNSETKKLRKQGKESVRV